MIIGTNWFMGYSHSTAAKDAFIRGHMTAGRIADILEVFMNAGVDTLLGMRSDQVLVDGVKEAEDRTGRKCITLSTPTLNVLPGSEALGEAERELDAHAALGVDVCMPHQQTTDALVDRVNRRITGMDRYVKMIRERGMIPGLSTHMPETPIYADETNLDVATYIQIYNAVGFLMQIEVDWVHRMIWQRKKPVLTIKPMAAGRMHPLAGLAFAWATIRPQDMVAVGTLTPDEAHEVVQMSLALLDRRMVDVELQTTRSKASVMSK
jgi:hypothetical protein